MEEARAVLERLVRIEQLRSEGARPDALLEELRALLSEAEEWTRVEGGEAGERAVAGLRRALAHDMIGV
jgi:Tfp pilus assembly protein PilN